MLKNLKEHIENTIKTLPESPGVYQYYDEDGKILYVGKAKNLKKRVSSYFTKEHENNRLRLLVRKIHEIKTINVTTEFDALLLENNLIKELQPRYNVNLKDDKTFPWICIKKERFPRVFYTRKHIKDGSEYFGPFASVLSVKYLLETIRQLYKIRTCSFELSEANIDKGKYRECLEFHINRCKAPCTAKQSEEDYTMQISEIRQIIKGNTGIVLKEIKDQIQQHITKLEFEKAQELKLKLDSLENFQSKSTVVSTSIDEVDVFSILSDSINAYVNYFRINHGAIIHGQTIELKKKLDETDEELLVYAILELRQRYNSQSKEIIVPFEPEMNLPNINWFVPKIGDKKKLLDLSLKNAETYKKEKEKQLALIDPEQHTNRLMQQMMKDLRLTEEPRRIECFDNSNIQGAYPVAAMTVFIDGKPAKKEYRHFNIKTVEGPNDFASMEEVIFRRYKRVIDETLELPQLIVIDGGKGQLSSAVISLDKLGLYGKVALIGIAKKLEEIYFPNDQIPLYLDKRSETLRIIQQIRDEAHRFGITHHRSKRSKEVFTSELNQIKGISDKTAERLLKEFNSVKQIKDTSLEQLELCIGKSKAALVFNYFHPFID